MRDYAQEAKDKELRLSAEAAHEARHRAWVRQCNWLCVLAMVWMLAFGIALAITVR